MLGCIASMDKNELLLCLLVYVGWLLWYTPGLYSRKLQWHVRVILFVENNRPRSMIRLQQHIQSR